MSEAPLILVVEDDYELQGTIEECLREGGFETHAFSSAEEELTLFKGKVAQYKALVADVNLKGRLSGWEIARQDREIAPDFPVVYMTGAFGDQWTSQGVPNSILLQKPFASAQLLTAVSQLLTTARSASPARWKGEARMAVNKPVGDNARKGAVKKRSQVRTKMAGARTWTKRDTSGEFMAVKKSRKKKPAKKFKGVRREKA